MIGQTLAHYQVTAAIGKGGMGEVWRARDTKLGREVAIKTLTDEFADDTDRLARFEREAKLLASLNHPNIAAIYGLEEHEGKRFLVLELVEGDTLAERIRQGAIPVKESLGLCLQIVEALEAAHEKGVIHRDLKPANIKITDEGKIKVLDFGLAKALSGETDDANLSQSPTLSMAATQQGIILGTAAYMSPEQAKGHKVDRRTDIWAFGCVLFEMLAGRPAFPGNDVSDILASVLKLDPEWSVLPKELNPKLAELVERCLEKERRNRYQDVGDIRVDMEKVVPDPSGEVSRSTMVTASTPSPRSRTPVIAAIVTTALIASLAVWVLKPEPEVPLPVTRFDYDLLDGQLFRNTGRPIFALSPDGRRFVYNTSTGIYLREMDELEARIIPGTEAGLTNPFFSPDGQWVGYFDGQITKIAISGGAPIPLVTATNPFGVSWEGDGTILFGQPDGIRRVSENGGEAELIIQARDGEQVHGPQLLPGGEWILFTTTTIDGQTRWDQAEIVAESLETHDRVVLWRGGGDGRYVPTGHLVYALDDGLFAVPFDLDSMAVAGGAVSIAEGVRRADGPQTTTASANYGLSQDGSLAYVTGVGGALAVRSLFWVDRTGREEPIAAEPRGYLYPRISPDGRRVAFDVRDEQDDVLVWDLGDETLTRLTFDAAGEGYPAWTPDGERIAYYHDRDFYWKASNNTGSATAIAEDPAEGGIPNPYFFSPDGTQLVFREQDHPDTEDNIGMLALDGGSEPEWLLRSEFNERNAELSSDGRWMAYQSDETGDWEIYVQPFPNVDDGRWQISNAGGFHPVWSRNTNELFYVQLDPTAIMIVADFAAEPDFVLGARRELFDVSIYFGAEGRNYDVSPDGERFLLIKTGATADGEAPPPQIVVVENWFEELRERLPVE